MTFKIKEGVAIAGTQFADADRNVTANSVAVSATTTSTSATTGAVTVSGGVGINENLNVGGNVGVSGDLTLTGNLTVNGTTTNINTTNLVVEDKNIVIADVATPTDTTADGGGITLKGATDKTFNWVDATDAWTSSEHVDLATNKSYHIAGTSVLNATTLGTGVTTSSLTTVGTIGTGTWQGTLIAGTYGGTGVNNGTKTITLGGNLTTSGAHTTTITTTANTSVTLPTTGTLATTGDLSQFAATTSAQLAGVISDETGTGALVFANTPTLVTPALGVATATSINKVAFTAPANGSTLVIADGKTLTASNTLTLTGTDSSSVAFGTGGTVAYATGNLGQFAATTSAQLAGVISDETGTGALVFADTPTLVTPALGVATATSINKVAFTAPANGSTLAIADGKTLTASNTLTFTGTDSSSVAFGAGGTVAYATGNLGQFAATTSAQLAGVISDETGTGALVFASSPALTTPTIAIINGSTTASGTLTLRSTSNATKATAGILLDETIASTTTATGALVVSGGLGVGGTLSANKLYLEGSREKFTTITGATGTVVHNATLSSIFYHTTPIADFTINFTNVPTTNDQTLVFVVIVKQGATPYIPINVSIDGTAQTLLWLGNFSGFGTANNTDVFSFILLRAASTWTVMANFASYGA
jgi:hypothetical protein